MARAGAALRWTVERLTILERRDTDGPFSIAHETLFGGASARRVSVAVPKPVELQDRVAVEATILAGQTVTVETFGSSRYAPALAADIDLLLIAGRDTPPATFPGALAEVLVGKPAPSSPGPKAPWSGPGGSLRAVPGDGMTSLRGVLGGRNVDLAVVFADRVEDADGFTLPEGARRALLGPRDAETLVQRLRAHGRYRAFQELLPLVRAWTDARAIRSNAFGYTGSFGWALLLAPPLLHDEKLSAMSPERALSAWFEWLAALPEGVDVTLDPVLEVDKGKRWRIRSPAAPFRNAARSFTRSTEAVLRDEARLAARRAKSAAISAEALALAAIPLEKDAPRGRTFEIRGAESVRGRYEGAFLSLLTLLEKETGGLVRPWGRFIDADGGWTHRFAIDSPAKTEDVEAAVNAWLAKSFAEPRPVLAGPL
jgi:hypothetical protein